MYIDCKGLFGFRSKVFKLVLNVIDFLKYLRPNAFRGEPLGFEFAEMQSKIINVQTIVTTASIC